MYYFETPLSLSADIGENAHGSIFPHTTNLGFTLKTETGVVKWFNNDKGFGFIMPDNGGKDLFAHFSEIQGSGHKTLEENQRVSFVVGQGQKGPCATQIVAL